MTTQDTETTKDVAVKADSGKPRLDLIAPEVLLAMGTVLDFGARKYAERNWEKGMSWGRVYAAAQRHLCAWQRGEDTDPESGLPHLWHAVTGLHFLVAYEIRESGVDDRSPYAVANSEIIDDDEADPEADMEADTYIQIAGTVERPNDDEDDDDDLYFPPTMEDRAKVNAYLDRRFQSGMRAGRGYK